jgi:ribonucleoside-diphosphate reductase alpha chain
MQLIRKQTKMIGPQNPFSQQLHAGKYRGEGETFDDYTVRYSRAVADDEGHRLHLLGALRDMRILPAGRQQKAVGTPHRVTAFNCFVGADIEDSMEGIMDELKRSALTLRAGGGMGWNFSTLRPKGEAVRGLGDGATSSGPVSFMKVWDAMCGTIMSAGFRRGAMMGVLDIDHPDALDFVHAKRTPGMLTNFNVSIAATNAFMDAVKSDGLYELRFKGQRYRDVRALDVWSVLMENNWDWAEPGVLFIDRINAMNPLQYCETLRATNPCLTGETTTLTRHGHERLDVLAAAGREVEIWDGEQFVSVLPRKTGTNSPLLRVRLSNGVELECTPYHGFDLATGVRVEARDLQPEDALQRYEMPVIEGGLDHSEAYTQGFFSGDGWVNHPTRDSASVILGLYGEKRALLESGRLTGVTSSSEIGGDRTYVYVEANHLNQDKAFVPGVDWSVQSRLDWLAGLSDADGAIVTGSPTAQSLQICSIDREFLLSVRLMLTTLGVTDPTVAISKAAKKTVMKNGSGGFAEYDCQTLHRLSLSPWNLAKLQAMGLKFNRLDTSKNLPKHSSARFTRVLEVLDEGKTADVYCYTNPISGRGTFDGVVTGQCGEQPLPAFGACLLGSLNLVRYLRPSLVQKGALFASSWDLDFELLGLDVAAAARAFDNVIDRTFYPLPEQEVEAKTKRRMGIGITGAANAFETMGRPYGTDEYIALQEEVLRFILNTAYRTSVQMAREKGSFALFDADLWLQSGFARSGALDEDVLEGIRRYGLRNGLMTSIAPTGTISLTADNVSSGLEPVFAVEQTRLVNMAGGQVEVELNDYAFAKYGTKPVTAERVTPRDHVRVLCSAQKYIDSAVSKTVNVKGKKAGSNGTGTTFAEFQSLYIQAYDGGAKGCTTFNSTGKRMGILLSNDADESAPDVTDAFGEDMPVLEGAACLYDPSTGVRTCDS